MKKLAFSQGDEPAIKQIRLALGFSQEKFAQALGTTLSSVKNWERGTHEPSFTAIQLKRFLPLLESVGLSPQELPDKLGREPKASTSQERDNAL